jgi:cell division septal protein FtsQ
MAGREPTPASDGRTKHEEPTSQAEVKNPEHRTERLKLVTALLTALTALLALTSAVLGIFFAQSRTGER